MTDASYCGACRYLVRLRSGSGLCSRWARRAGRTVAALDPLTEAREADPWGAPRWIRSDACVRAAAELAAASKK